MTSTGSPRVTFGWAAVAVLASLVGGAVLKVLMVLLTWDLDYWYLVGVAAAIIVLQRVVRSVFGKQETPPVPLRPRAPDVLGARRPFAEVTRWENRMSWTSGDADRFESAVRPRLRELAAERLRQRHGVDLGTDPRAPQLIGRPLWDFLHQRLATTPTPEQLAWYVARMEEI